MELLIKSVQSILDEKLSVLKRGILISILLCKDDNPNITLAKFKATCKYTLLKKELVELHEDNLIKWRGYKSAKKSLDNDEYKEQRDELVDFMNNLYRRNFKKNTTIIVSSLTSRIKEVGVDDVRLVISNRYSVWKDDSFMAKYLTPETIFKKSKFDKYLEDAKSTRVGESFVFAKNIDLKDGDEITESVSKAFSDKDVYNIKIYNCDGSGRLLGAGIHAKRYGKDIKRTFKINKINKIKTHRYYYVEK
jgi:uncharacterized phage protein (TIGR02220 family)